MRLHAFDAELMAGAKASRLIGVDEAGRGPLAGPVVVAAVRLEPGCERMLKAVRDSKLLTAAKREELFELIRVRADIAVGWAHPREIEKLNILRATLFAMRRAVERLGDGLVVVDGPHKIPRLKLQQRAVVDGDAKSLSVACASVVAKVLRDRWMARLDRNYPGYGFAKHKGYGTQDHIQALRTLGPSRVHRRTYAPVKELL